MLFLKLVSIKGGSSQIIKCYFVSFASFCLEFKVLWRNFTVKGEKSLYDPKFFLCLVLM